MPSPLSAPPQEVPQPRLAMAPARRAEPIAAPTPPLPVPNVRRSAGLTDTLAGELTPQESMAFDDESRPGLVAESTRSLLSSGSRENAYMAPPDTEERRLSHDLDFGEAARPRLAREGGGTRRAVVILILLILSAGVAAVIFETQIVDAVPALGSIYAQLGL
jgi:hypothetical protein